MKKVLSVFFILSVFAFWILGQSVHAGTQDAAPISGKVVETMNSGGYTYALVEKEGKKTWVAVPKMTITKGQSVSFKPGVEMVNFRSKTLNRTFESIIFSAGAIK
ncbi:MAG: hypothetical protein M1497_10150 [Nitrospirae bacterium]|nr:hypothetical protein [Nitrospirota bacterium]